MQPVNLFALATQQADWLASRQAAVAGNIANVNTPGYKAVDVAPFQSVLDKTGVSLVATQKGHFGAMATEAGLSGTKLREDTSAVTVLPSKNSVVLENELLKAGEVSRNFELNTAIVKAFHRMMMLSVKA
jgi:flagellar basal-body rod protein FlgB